MEKKKLSKEKKGVYQKPELLKVPLRPEEAVLGNCKMSGTSGPGGGDCAVPVCFSTGS